MGQMASMRARVAVAIAVVIALAAASFAGDAVELIADAGFARGLRAKDRGGVEQSVRWGEGTGRPVWQVAQHFSKSCIADSGRRASLPGGFAHRDDYAWLAIHPGGEEGDVILGLNAFAEYGGAYRAKGDPWPHLYLSQRVSEPGGHLGTRSPSVADMERLDLSIGVRLIYDRRHVGEGYDRSVHASQFLFFLTIQNLNRKSPGYGDYYWFGAAPYDDRKPITALHAMKDAGSAKKPGTGKFIYDIGIRPFTDAIVSEGRWVEVKGDLLPHAIAGLREAWGRGYLPGSTNLSDYRVGSVVMGWEIPGLNDAAMAVRGLRLVAKRRDGAREIPAATGW